MYHSNKTALAIIVPGVIFLISFCNKQPTKLSQDTNSPTIAAVSPAKDTTDVAINTQVSVTFSEDIRAVSHLDIFKNNFQIRIS